MLTSIEVISVFITFAVSLTVLSCFNKYLKILRDNFSHQQFLWALSSIFAVLFDCF